MDLPYTHASVNLPEKQHHVILRIKKLRINPIFAIKMKSGHDNPTTIRN
jgi:hypothetical protein